MGRKRSRLRGPAAASALAVASLMGPAAADAQSVICEPECPVPEFNPPNDGLGKAFSKHAEQGFPGSTAGAFFSKVGGTNAFQKVSELGFPGGTENVFLKIK